MQPTLSLPKSMTLECEAWLCSASSRCRLAPYQGVGGIGLGVFTSHGVGGIGLGVFTANQGVGGMGLGVLTADCVVNALNPIAPVNIAKARTVTTIHLLI